MLRSLLRCRLPRRRLWGSIGGHKRIPLLCVRPRREFTVVQTGIPQIIVVRNAEEAIAIIRRSNAVLVLLCHNNTVSQQAFDRLIQVLTYTQGSIPQLLVLHMEKGAEVPFIKVYSQTAELKQKKHLGPETSEEELIDWFKSLDISVSFSVSRAEDTVSWIMEQARQVEQEQPRIAEKLYYGLLMGRIESFGRSDGPGQSKSLRGIATAGLLRCATIQQQLDRCKLLFHALRKEHVYNNNDPELVEACARALAFFEVARVNPLYLDLASFNAKYRPTPTMLSYVKALLYLQRNLDTGCKHLAALLETNPTCLNRAVARFTKSLIEYLDQSEALTVRLSKLV